jgi:hypothetical protein
MGDSAAQGGTHDHLAGPSCSGDGPALAGETTSAGILLCAVCFLPAADNHKRRGYALPQLEAGVEVGAADANSRICNKCNQRIIIIRDKAARDTGAASKAEKRPSPAAASVLGQVAAAPAPASANPTGKVRCSQRVLKSFREEAFGAGKGAVKVNHSALLNKLGGFKSGEGPTGVGSKRQ